MNFEKLYYALLYDISRANDVLSIILEAAAQREEQFIENDTEFYFPDCIEDDDCPFLKSE